MCKEIKFPNSRSRMNRISKLVERYGEKSSTITFMGAPINDLSREQLMAILCYLSEKNTEMLNARSQRIPTRGAHSEYVVMENDNGSIIESTTSAPQKG